MSVITVGHTDDCDYSSIAKAIADILPDRLKFKWNIFTGFSWKPIYGDNIILIKDDGLYKESITIDKPNTTLIGMVGSPIIIGD